MKVERNAPKPLKAFPIAIQNNVEKKLYNLHIYDDKSRDERQFVFVLSKDENEVKTMVKENILATITLKDQNEVKYLVQQLGKAVKEVKELERESYDHDFINAINNLTQNINKNIWVSNAANRYISQAEVLEIKEKAKLRKEAAQNLTGDDLLVKSIRPIVLIETLGEMGVLNLQGTQPNGNDELKHKFTFMDTVKHGSSKFNISVAKYGYLQGNKGNVFNDFANSKTKAFGGGSVGLLCHLAEHGLFDIRNKNNDEIIDFAKEYIVKNIAPNISEDKLVAPNEKEKNRVYFEHKAATFQPIVKYNKRTMDTMSDFLEYRGISKDRIQKMIKNGNIITGDFYNSKITEEYDDEGNLKLNYAYKNVPYFRLRNSFNNQFYGAERFVVKRVNNPKKPFDYNKLNIGSVDGKYWSDGEQKKPVAAIIHEAIIDGISSMEILGHGGLDPESFRYMSTQGASHFQKFMKKNIGFWAEKTKDRNGKEEWKSFAVYFNQKDYDISEDILKEYQDKFKNRQITFFDYGDTPKSLIYKLKSIEPILGTKINIEKTEREKINFDNYDKKEAILIDKENFYDFVESIKLKIKYDEAKKKNVVKTIYVRENKVPFDAKKKNAILAKVKKFFGTDHLIFCLDNDHAGLKYLPVFSEMEKHLGINVGYMVPNDNVKPDAYKSFSGLRLNDMMSQYKDLCSKNKHQQAYTLLTKYIKQEPEIDNNDVLKEYLRLKNSNPQAAQELIQSKIQELNLPSNSPALKKKVKQRLKP
jgi:hypothetical protein